VRVGAQPVTSPWGAWCGGISVRPSMEPMTLRRACGVASAHFALLSSPSAQYLLTYKAFTPGNYSDEAEGYLKAANRGFWGNVFKG